jgi:hypothetical protein
MPKLKDKILKIKIEAEEVVFESSIENLGCMLEEQLSNEALIELVKALDKSAESEVVTDRLYKYFKEERDKDRA